MRKVNACNLNGAKKQQHLGVEFCSREKGKKNPARAYETNPLKEFQLRQNYP